MLSVARSRSLQSRHQLSLKGSERVSAFKYDVYLSHVPSDEEFAARLTEALRNQGITIISRFDFSTGAILQESSFAAVRDCQFVIVVLTPNYILSPQRGEERSRVLEREKLEARTILLPAYLEACDLPTDLADRVRVDFRMLEHYPKKFPEGVKRLLETIRRPNPQNPIFQPAAGASSQAESTVARTYPEPDLPSLEVPLDLVQSCKAGECVLFAGAGLSARAGGQPGASF
jgi:TIR domain